MKINEIQKEIVEIFSQFDDWMDKYSLLIEYGNELEGMDEKLKTQQNLIDGCQSRVWLWASYEEGRVVYKGESDAVLVKGIVSLLIKVLSNHSATEIANTDLFFIEQIGLKAHLSPTRSNGLLAMVKQMKFYALAYQSKYEV